MIHITSTQGVRATYSTRWCPTSCCWRLRSIPFRDWLSRIRIDWTKIWNIRVSETDLPQGVTSHLRTTIQKHPNVFKPGLETVRRITAKLEMKPDASPKFCKARHVPYAFQEAVEAECNHLETKEIVVRVEFSEWATAMVHVPKANGATRSCGDYAVTVNTQLQVPQYPISLPENVFLKLCGGQRSYASRSLKSSESFYTTLFGRKFFLRTDHKPLLKMFAMDSAKDNFWIWKHVMIQQF